MGFMMVNSSMFVAISTDNRYIIACGETIIDATFDIDFVQNI